MPILKFFAAQPNWSGIYLNLGLYVGGLIIILIFSILWWRKFHKNVKNRVIRIIIWVIMIISLLFFSFNAYIAIETVVHYYTIERSHRESMQQCELLQDEKEKLECVMNMTF